MVKQFLKCYSHNIVIQAFPQEFVKVENSSFCKENFTNVLKVFTIPDYVANDHVKNNAVMNDCEIYCALEITCLACIKVCNKECQWNAVTNCDQKKSSANDSVTQSLSQKPGKLIPMFYVRNKTCQRLLIFIVVNSFFNCNSLF